MFVILVDIATINKSSIPDSPYMRMSAARLVGFVAVASVSLIAAYLLYMKKVGEYSLHVDIFGVKSSLVILIYPEGGV